MKTRVQRSDCFCSSNGRGAEVLVHCSKIRHNTRPQEGIPYIGRPLEIMDSSRGTGIVTSTTRTHAQMHTIAAVRIPTAKQVAKSREKQPRERVSIHIDLCSRNVARERVLYSSWRWMSFFSFLRARRILLHRRLYIQFAATKGSKWYTGC